MFYSGKFNVTLKKNLSKIVVVVVKHNSRVGIQTFEKRFFEESIKCRKTEKLRRIPLIYSFSSMSFFRLLLLPLRVCWRIIACESHIFLYFLFGRLQSVWFDYLTKSPNCDRTFNCRATGPKKVGSSPYLLSKSLKFRLSQICKENQKYHDFFGPKK